MLNPHRVAGAALLSLLLLAGCGGGSTAGSFRTGAPQKLGDPIAGLTQAELNAFERGRLVFERRFRPSEGLGPLYNATSCASCHSTPVTGGSAGLYRNFYLARTGNEAVLGAQVDLPDLPSAVVPAFGPRGPHASAKFSLEGGRPIIPHGTPGLRVAQRNPIPIFGVGLFEFVTDVTIRSHADPDDRDADGISGRVNLDAGFVGRFGVKAQANNIEAFTRPPLMNQMGITSDPFEGSGGIVSGFQVSGGGATDTRLVDGDDAPDPEISRADLGDLILFSRFLAPPRRKSFNTAALRGETLFEDLGCVECHIPSLPSRRGTVEAYTDLLLHDMGSALADGMSFGEPEFSSLDPATSHREFRTQPLWGVSMHAPYLFDGRAETILDAIKGHAGESQEIKDAFLALTSAEQADVIAFLEHL